MDGRNYRPKHVELIVIINKNLLLLHLVGSLYYCISDASHTNIRLLTSVLSVLTDDHVLHESFIPHGAVYDNDLKKEVIDSSETPVDI